MPSPDITKLVIGPANIYLTENAVQQFVGGIAGAQISIKQTWADLTADNLGVTAVNKILVGVEAWIEFSFREIDLINFSRAILGSKSYIDDVTPTKRRVEVYPRVGQDLASIARKLELKPIVGGVETTDKEKWIVADKAAPDSETIQWAYQNAGQREIQARFWLMPDSANNNRLFYMGEPTITDTAPSGFTGIW